MVDKVGEEGLEGRAHFRFEKIVISGHIMISY